MSKRVVNLIALLLSVICLSITFCFGCSLQGGQGVNNQPPSTEQPPPTEQPPSTEQPPEVEPPESDEPDVDIPKEDPPTKKTIKLRIGSYNVCHCADWSKAEGDNVPVSPGKTASLLSEIGYDIVGLQEVYESGGTNPLLTNQTSLLLRYSNLTYGVFGLGEYFEWGQSIGNAVLSKYPILSKTLVAVPKPTDEEKRPTETQWYEDRIIVKTTIKINNHINIDFNIDYITTHFGLNKLEQENMIEALIKVIDGCQNPVVLCGDFNSDPTNKIQAPLRERLISVADVVGNSNEYTASSLNPYAALDYVFVSKEFKVKSYQVVKTVLSDHFPIVAEVEIEI